MGTLSFFNVSFTKHFWKIFFRDYLKIYITISAFSLLVDVLSGHITSCLHSHCSMCFKLSNLCNCYSSTRVTEWNSGSNYRPCTYRKHHRAFFLNWIFEQLWTFLNKLDIPVTLWITIFLDENWIFAMFITS